MHKMFEGLGRDAHNNICLTANRRLSRFLINQYHKQQTQQSKQSWESPKILSLNSWIEALAIKLPTVGAHATAPEASESLTTNNIEQEFPMLLSETLERQYWRGILTEWSEQHPLLNTQSLIEEAQGAWRLLKQWCLSLSHLDSYQGIEAGSFKAWATRFDQILKQEGLIDRASLPDHLVQHLNRLSLPDNLWLYGFDEFTPQIERLLKSLRDVGCAIYEIQTQKATSVPVRIALHDTEAEIKTMARWAGDVINQDPTAQVGCVVPALNQLRKPIEYHFTQIFAPEKQLPWKGQLRLPVNISSGEPLVHFPMVAAGLNLLSLNRRKFTVDEITTILLSPFVAQGQQEWTARALLDTAIRSQGKATITLDRLNRLTQTSEGAEDHGTWTRGLTAFIDINQQLPHRALPSLWTELFKQQLGAMQWPGERGLTSVEYQQHQHFQQLLRNFSSLDQLRRKVSLPEALNQLKDLAKNHLFQPKDVESQVQVLGLLEAAGMSFTHLWIMGLSDKQWPQVPRPNHLLPLGLQRHYQMPHATSEREESFSRKMTERLLSSAKAIVVSHPQQEDDQPAAPSTLIESLCPISLDDLNLKDHQDYQLKQYGSASLEYFIDDQGLPLTEQQIQGGSRLLQDQAACPFRAYAKHRLHAKGIDIPENLLQPSDRGILLHSALAKIWEKIKHSRQLNALSKDQLTELIQDSVDSTLRSFRRQWPETLGKRLMQLENSRLTQLIEQWLAVEKTRTEAFSVMACEQRSTVTINGITLSLQADRIDQLEDGRQIILDYKTGRVSISKWFGDRPDNPQLLLYAVANHRSPIAGIAFAQIRPPEIRFQGLTEIPCLPHVPTIKELKDELLVNSWKALSTSWKGTIEDLLNEFKAGIAIVDPKGPQSCQYCDLPSLCRIDDISFDTDSTGIQSSSQQVTEQGTLRDS